MVEVFVTRESAFRSGFGTLGNRKPRCIVPLTEFKDLLVLRVEMTGQLPRTAMRSLGLPA
jgi:hypothetical protein